MKEDRYHHPASLCRQQEVPSAESYTPGVADRGRGGLAVCNILVMSLLASCIVSLFWNYGFIVKYEPKIRVKRCSYWPLSCRPRPLQYMEVFIEKSKFLKLLFR